jgi:hypothetical protein
MTSPGAVAAVAKKVRVWCKKTNPRAKKIAPTPAKMPPKIQRNCRSDIEISKFIESLLKLYNTFDPPTG